MDATKGRGLGAIVAVAVTYAEWAAGVVGWIFAAVDLTIVFGAVAGGRPLMVTFLRAIVDPFLTTGIALVLISVLRRGMHNWAGELGLKLGLLWILACIGFAILPWLFVDDADSALSMSAAALTAGALGVPLALACARLRPDKSQSIQLAVRRWFNGAKSDGSRCGVFDAAGRPLFLLVLLAVAAFGVIHPTVPAGWMNAAVKSFADVLRRIDRQHFFGAVPNTMPPWFSTPWPWSIAAGVCAVSIYVAFRKIGSGSARRGSVLSLLATVQLGAATFAVFDLANAFITLDGAAVGGAVIAAVLAYECRRRWQRMTMWQDIDTSMFPR
jgi:hypothetical protein